MIGADAVADWYSEITQYNFNKPGFSSATGHFTQVVWNASTHLGGGYALTSDGQSVYVVAQYKPQGNSGNYVGNVFPAKC